MKAKEEIFYALLPGELEEKHPFEQALINMQENPNAEVELPLSVFFKMMDQYAQQSPQPTVTQQGEDPADYLKRNGYNVAELSPKPIKETEGEDLKEFAKLDQRTFEKLSRGSFEPKPPFNETDGEGVQEFEKYPELREIIQNIATFGAQATLTGGSAWSHFLRVLNNSLKPQTSPPAPDCNWSEEHINGRIKYLKNEEFQALRELDSCPVGSIARQAKWAFIREFASRRSELEMLLRGDNLEKPLP